MKMELVMIELQAKERTTMFVQRFRVFKLTVV